MKKIGAIVYCGLLVLVISFLILSKVSAAEISDISDSGIIQDARAGKEFIEEKKWEYLSEQWKELLLNNSMISKADAFLKKIDGVFFVLFGQHYELSLALFFIVLFWIFFFLLYGNILFQFSSFGKLTSYAVAFLLSVITAQLTLYRIMSEFLFKAIFFKEGMWRWIGFALFFVFYIFILAFLNKIVYSLGRSMKYSDKAEREKIEKIEQESLQDMMNKIDKAFKEK